MLNFPLSTRDRLLNAAESLFAARGFQGASLRAILSEADFSGQIALIQYHFGNKLDLYRAVWDRAMPAVASEEPIKPLVNTQVESSTQSQLRNILRAFLAGPNSLGASARGRAMLAIIRQELADPSHVERGLVAQWLEPAADKLEQDLLALYPKIEKGELALLVRLMFAVAQGQMENASEGWRGPALSPEASLELTLSVLAAGIAHRDWA